MKSWNISWNHYLNVLYDVWGLPCVHFWVKVPLRVWGVLILVWDFPWKKFVKFREINFWAKISWNWKNYLKFFNSFSWSALIFLEVTLRSTCCCSSAFSTWNYVKSWNLCENFVNFSWNHLPVFSVGQSCFVSHFHSFSLKSFSLVQTWKTWIYVKFREKFREIETNLLSCCSLHNWFLKAKSWNCFCSCFCSNFNSLNSCFLQNEKNFVKSRFS